MKFLFGLLALLAIAAAGARGRYAEARRHADLHDPGGRAAALDGHRETTYATVHATAPFYSVLIRINPD